jgi:anti-anti-sigma factor
MTDRKIDIAIEEEGDITVVIMDGALDSSNLRYFKNELDPLINEQDRNVLLDCTELTYASSQVFGLFSCYNKISKSKKKVFGLCSVSSQMYNILDILGLVPVFHIYETREVALQELNKLIQNINQE